jgi:two-component system OmpR family sensor kinase
VSLKARLALINTLFVLLALGIGFFLLAFQTRRVFLDSLDRDLLVRAGRMQRNPALRGVRPGGPGGGQQGGQPRQGQPQGNPNESPLGEGEGLGMPPEPDQGPNGGSPNDGPPGRPNLGPEFNGPPNDDLGRPALFTPEGKPMDQREVRTLDPKALPLKDQKHPFLSTVTFQGNPTRVITILFLTPFALLLSVGVGWFLASKAVKPIQDFATASERISDSDMSARLPVSGNDEISRLSNSFNEMVDRLQLSFNERQRLNDGLREALELQKQFVADASHELRTPLTRLRITTSSALEQESSPAELKEAIEIADRETVHMSKLIDQLLTLARLDSGRSPSLIPVDLSEIVREAIGQPFEGLTVNLAHRAPLLGDHDSLVRVVVNLVENAKRYSEGKGIEISTQQADGRCVLSVRDHGIGIESEHLARLTERFYRVDDARNRKMGGTGLGLAIVKSIVDAHHGTMSIQSKPGEGTLVQLIFPKSV